MSVVVSVIVGMVMYVVVTMEHYTLLSCQVLVSWRENIQYVHLVFRKFSWLSKLN